MSLSESRRLWLSVLIAALFALTSIMVTGSYITEDTPTPLEGLIEPPEEHSPLSQGIMMVVLDGVPRDMLLDAELMPAMNAHGEEGTTLMIRTGPLTMTGACVREMATGVTSRPNQGLANFHPDHPGTNDGYNLAATLDQDNDGEPDKRVVMIGDYVWRDLYGDMEIITKYRHYKGHADFYEGDEEAMDRMFDWTNENRTLPEDEFGEMDFVVAHLSGTDHVGHRWGHGDEFEEKLLRMDTRLEEIFSRMPENWTYIITMDHGATDGGRHGSPDNELREVAAIMWGAGISSGVTIDNVEQRDLATLPLTLFALPYPWSIEGQIPLDAFDINQTHKDALEAWNWEAIVHRQEWLEENGYPAVTGLSAEEIEWDKILVEELGIRDIDVIISTIGWIGLITILLYTLSKIDFERKQLVISGTIFVVALGISYLFSRGQSGYLAGYNRMLGAIVVLLLFGMIWRVLAKQSSNPLHSPWIAWGLLAFVMIYPDSRMSYGIFILFALCVWTLFRHCKGRSMVEITAWVSLGLDLSIPVFIGHHRMIGFHGPEILLLWTQPEDWLKTLIGSTIVFSAALVSYWLWMPELPRKEQMVPAGILGILPVMMYFESNIVDWCVLASLFGLFVLGAWKSETAPILGRRWCDFAAIGWLTISWGAWASIAAMLFISSIYRLMRLNGHHILIPRGDRSEHWRFILIALMPWALWMMLWWLWAQVYGFGVGFSLHTREIDPGAIFLRGGYIGDRVSPSNFWVGFMGGGPVGEVSLAFFAELRRLSVPLWPSMNFLIFRSTAMFLLFAVSPDLPRLMFKSAWDAVLAVTLCLLIFPFFIHELKKGNSALIESE